MHFLLLHMVSCGSLEKLRKASTSWLVSWEHWTVSLSGIKGCHSCNMILMICAFAERKVGTDSQSFLAQPFVSNPYFCWGRSRNLWHLQERGIYVCGRKILYYSLFSAIPVIVLYECMYIVCCEKTRRITLFPFGCSMFTRYPLVKFMYAIANTNWNGMLRLKSRV